MKHLMLLVLILWSSLLLAQETGIPTKYMNDPAVDLVRNGKLLWPDEVHELFKNSKETFDLSTLNPVETSDLWKNAFPKTLPAEISPINDDDEVTYHSPVLSTSGIFRFNILNQDGDKKFYTMMLSKTVHTALLYKSALRKIGYQVPDIKHLSRITIKFKNKTEKLTFKNYLVNVAMADSSAKDWIVEEQEDKLVLQDIVVMSPNNSIYNLAFGVTQDMVQGRRLLSAVAVPLSIVNLTESVNMLHWNIGTITNKRISLEIDNLEEFQCTWDDARWITRRLEKLTREDWKEIVSSSQIPKVVQQILLEKIIARRNSAMKLFKVDAEQMAIDTSVDNGIELVDGKLTQRDWPGYASQFAYGDKESPLSDSDMKSWVKSRAISTAMEIALGQLNQQPFLGTDIEALNTEKYQKIITDAVTKSVTDKTPFEVPVKAWTFPTFRGNLIFSRNLVTGTYLGTDNLVQLVDTVGVSLSAGMFAGVAGFKTKKIGTPALNPVFTPIKVSGGVQASYLRTYAHLRPVTNIKQSLKYPFKNIFVPLVKKDLGEKLHEAYNIVISPTASDEDKEKVIAAALQPFKDTMNVGESLLVTDTLVTGVSGQAGVNLYGKLLSASLGLNANHIVLSRFHVHRRSDNNFHIYRDLGHKGSVGVNLSLNSLIPVVSLTYKKTGGHAKVKFFNLNLDPASPDSLKAAEILRSAIVHSSTSGMEENKIKPYVVKHAFKESNPSMNLLFWQYFKQNSSTDMTIQNPEGEEKYFRRHYYGNTSGRNYQAYVNALINHWVGLLFSKEAGLSDATGTNPGYSFKGSAKTKFLTLDQELDAKGEVLEPFVSLSRVWNGWSITRKKAEELLEELRHQYKFQFFAPAILNNTTKLKLYSIGVNMFFYKNGLEYLLGLEENKIKRIFLEHQIHESLGNSPVIGEETDHEDYDSEKYTDSGVNKFLRLLKRYKKLDLKNKDDRAQTNLLKALSYMEKTIYLPGIVKMVGGDENIFVTAKISGFRDGEEDGGDLKSDTLGEIGSQRVYGPVNQMQKTTDMLEGEFFINWMMQRLI